MEKKYVYTIQRDSAEKIGKLNNDLKKVLEKDKVDTHDLLMNDIVITEKSTFDLKNG